MRILAVDDDPTILDMLRSCLNAQHDFDLVCAETAEDALTMIRQDSTPFDCFLLDIILPGANGIELCAEIRAMPDHKSTPIIMITGSRKHDLMETAFRAGATDFIFKPLNGVELGARINTAGLLNESMRREREASHTLAELTSLMKIRRDESFDLNVPGVDDLNGFENKLLRLPTGCYAMSLFAVKLPQIRNIFDTLDPAEFCRQMVRIASALVIAVEDKRCFLGYAGNGMIVGAIMSRTRTDPARIQQDLEALLAEDALTAQGQGDIGVDVSVRSVSSQRLWSGLSACNEIRDFLGKDLPPYELDLEITENAFSF